MSEDERRTLERRLLADPSDTDAAEALVSLRLRTEGVAMRTLVERIIRIERYFAAQDESSHNVHEGRRRSALAFTQVVTPFDVLEFLGGRSPFYPPRPREEGVGTTIPSRPPAGGLVPRINSMHIDLFTVRDQGGNVIGRVTQLEPGAPDLIVLADDVLEPGEPCPPLRFSVDMPEDRANAIRAWFQRVFPQPENQVPDNVEPGVMRICSVCHEPDSAHPRPGCHGFEDYEHIRERTGRRWTDHLSGRVWRCTTCSVPLRGHEMAANTCDLHFLHRPGCDYLDVDPAIGRPTKPCNCRGREASSGETRPGITGPDPDEFPDGDIFGGTHFEDL